MVFELSRDQFIFFTVLQIKKLPIPVLIFFRFCFGFLNYGSNFDSGFYSGDIFLKYYFSNLTSNKEDQIFIPAHIKYVIGRSMMKVFGKYRLKSPNQYLFFCLFRYGKRVCFSSGSY